MAINIFRHFSRTILDELRFVTSNWIFEKEEEGYIAQIRQAGKQFPSYKEKECERTII